MPQRDRSVNSRRRPAIISSQSPGPAKPAGSSTQDNLRMIANEAITAAKRGSACLGSCSPREFFELPP
jgi:hypothetical protein